MHLQPTFRTTRLILRPFEKKDAVHVQRLASTRSISRYTLNIPYPYEDGLAESWINTHPNKFDSNEEAVFAICLNSSDSLIGAIGLMKKPHLNPYLAEMGYWIGRDYWGKGYCTEAAKEIARFGFEEWLLKTIEAEHFTCNPASGQVLQKLGMTRVGVLRQHVYKDDHFEDVAIWSLLEGELKQ